MADTIFNKTADSTLDVYKPAKVLQISFSAATGYKNWTHNDGEGDPWWSGGGSAKPYQYTCLLYTSPSPRDRTRSRMPSSA